MKRMTLKQALADLRASLGPLTEEQATKLAIVEAIAETFEYLDPDYIDGTPI